MRVPESTVPSSNALVVDDHPMVARGMAEFLTTHCGFTQVHTAADAAACRACIESEGRPSLAVIDFWLPDGAALQLLRELGDCCPLTRLLAVSGDDDARIQAKVRESGAHGFLHKHEPPEVFARAVTALLQGRDWFGTDAIAAVQASPRRELPVHARDLGLTERQGQVFALIVRGLPNKRIAQALSLSEQTVKEHMTSILARMGVTNRVQAIALLRGRRFEP